MTCAHVRDSLAALLYGDLATEEAAELRAHIAACADCTRELEALERVRRALDTVSVPTAPVDLSRLYREAAAADRRRLRRWRRAAWGVFASAAAVLVAVAIARLEVRADHQQLVIRWGEPIAKEANPAPRHGLPMEPPPAATLSPEQEHKLQLLSDLIRLVAEDVEGRDTQRRHDFTRLQQRLDQLQRQAATDRRATERDVAALYNAHFGPREKGARP